MRIALTKPLFAWEELEDSPSLATLGELLRTLPDGRLLASLRQARGKGRDDYPVHVLWGVVVLSIACRHSDMEACLAELRRNASLCRLRPACAPGLDLPPVPRHFRPLSRPRIHRWTFLASPSPLTSQSPLPCSRTCQALQRKRLRMPFRPASEPRTQSIATFVLGAERVESRLPPAPRRAVVNSPAGSSSREHASNDAACESSVLFVWADRVSSQVLSFT